MHPTVVVAGRARVVALVLLLVAGIAGAVQHPPLAQADDTPRATPSVVASITQMAEGAAGVTYSTRAPRIISSSLSGGLDLVWGDSPLSSLDFESDAQRPLHTGVYADVQPAADTGTLSFDVYGDRDFEPRHGEFDVLDLATDGDGNITRVDIVFITSTIDYTNAAFGEVRINEPSTALSPSALALRWPTVPRHGAKAYAVETLTNTTGATIKVGSAKIVHGATDDFGLRKDHCSRHSLASGSSCTLEVGFSATQGGPRNALLDVPAGGDDVTVSLAGSGRIGTTKITVSGSYAPDRKTTVYKTVLVNPLVGDASSTGYQWNSSVETRGRPHGIDLRVSGPRPLAVGEHATGPHGPYYADTLLDYSCSDQEGTIDIRAFRTDAYDIPTDAKIDLDQQCGKVGYHGQLLWQHRDDTSAPAKPSKLRISGDKARWTGSSSHDAVSTVVRVLPGSGADGSPLNGWAVSAGRASSAALPTLVAGQPCTLLAYSVDKTGNVSVPTTLAFTA